jgi:hypothetical protein
MAFPLPFTRGKFTGWMAIIETGSPRNTLEINEVQLCERLSQTYYFNQTCAEFTSTTRNHPVLP